MGLSSRSAVAIHALTMVARWDDRPLTSAEIADSLASNPVLVRRISLRKAGLVRSTEGRNGGLVAHPRPAPHQPARRRSSGTRSRPCKTGPPGRRSPP